MICPDCDKLINNSASICSVCGWELKTEAGVQIAVGKKDRENSILKEYIDNYDDISVADLDVGIVDDQYVKNLAKNLAELVGPTAGKDVIDVGVGKGYVLSELVDRGVKSATAVDISLGYLRSLSKNKKIRCVQANAENLPFFREFDLLVSTDVMEHVLNIGSFLICANRSLRPEGRLVIRVPYRESLLQYSPRQGCPYRFVHLRTFDKRVLRDYLESAGFSVEQMSFDGYFFGHPFSFLMRTRFRNKIYRAFEMFLVWRYGGTAGSTLLPKWIAQFLMPPLEIIAIAKKKSEPLGC